MKPASSSCRKNGAPGPGVSLQRPCPARTFVVPEEVKHLEPERIEALSRSFRSWVEAAKRPDTRLSRQRVELIYLLVRHGGARLGEVLALDDRADIDLSAGVARFGGEEDAGSREVRLPDSLVGHMRELFDTPAFVASRGAVFHMDGGYIRRKFYERARECGIPTELSNPRVLRHSRAVELLRGGLPLTVVQHLLGHGSVNLTAHYLRFQDEDIRGIVNFYLQKEARMKTSARNSFIGTVTTIRKGMILSEVVLKTASELEVVSVITNESLDKLGIAAGVTLLATIKAPHVIIVKEPDEQKTSMRNRFHGVIARINEGQVAAEVVVALPDGTEICALVTDVSVKSLGLKVGDGVWAMFKAFAVVLNVE